MDRLTRLGEFSHGFTTGYELFQAARDQGLVDDQGIGRLAVWVGELVGEGLVVFQSQALGQPVVPPGRTWGDAELQSHFGYRVSVAGRADAERTRRLRREVQAESVLAGRLQLDGIPPVDAAGREAILSQVGAMQQALIDERWPEAVSAAKNLVESAAKAVLAARGETPAKGAKLSPLYREALSGEAGGGQAEPSRGWSLARGLVGVVQGLAEMRNAVGAGHGHATPRAAEQAEAELAAGLAVVLVRHLVRAV